MCGLVSVFGRLTWDDRKRFETLLKLDVIRGEDSTGLFTVEGNQCSVYKSLALPSEFLQIKTVEKMIRDADNILVGHNRAATLGAVNAANAHPFQHGDITLVHNGTLRGQGGLTKQYGSYYSAFTESDSEAICASLAEADDPANVIENLTGAFALIWYDRSDQSLNFVRNSERPLHYLETTGDRAMFLSSEAGILYAALTRGNGAYNLESNPDGYITEVPVGVLHKVTFKGNGEIDNVDKRELSVAKKSWGNTRQTSHRGTTTGNSRGTSNSGNQQSSQDNTSGMYKVNPSASGKSATGKAGSTGSKDSTGSKPKEGQKSTAPKEGEVIPFDSGKKHSVAEHQMYQKLGLNPGWYDCYYVSFTGYKGNTRLGDLTVCLDGFGYNHAVIHGVEDPDDDTASMLQVYITGLSMTAHDNSKVDHKGNYTLTGKDFRSSSSTPAEVTDPKFKCQNCMEHIPEGDGYIESSSYGKMCSQCYYGDSEVRDLLALEGLTDMNMRYD